jgi:hypothetical protein
MDAEDLSSFALLRVDAYDGMVVDAVTWSDAHAYHQLAQRLHVRALHGWGIAGGLAVMATDPPSRSLIVQPGLAVDRAGNAVRVPDPLRLDVKQSQPGTVCIVLRFAEAPAGSGNGDRPSRVAEAFQLLECVPPLHPDDLELARLQVADGRAPFRQATDPWAPAAGEIDRRFRRELRPQTVETVTVGRLVVGNATDAGLHRQGLINAVRELRPAAPFVMQYAGDVSPETAAGTCDLLYLTGAGELRLSPREAAHLQAYLRTGAVLFAEPCVEQETQQQENGRFVASLQQLLADLQFPLEEVRAGHPLFQARYVFGTAPQGMGGHAPLLCRGNAVVNPNDYGCYWQGGTASKPLMREPIRSTMEFAANLAWYAAAAARLRA